MAIQVRRGLQKDFKPDKMLPGEMAVTTDTRRIYATFAPGDCKRMATYEDMQDDIKEANEEIITELTESVTTATQAATSATTAAQTATTNANKAIQDAATAVSNADTATSEANAAASEARSAAEDAHKAVIDDSAASTSRTYSSSKINALIAGVTGFSVEVVDQLPESNIDTHKIYFVPKETSKQTAGDIYDEYLYVQNAWEHIGTTDVDLSQYYTKMESNVRDLKDNVVEYTSNDSTTALDATPPAVMTSGEKLSALLGKLSTFGKNVRWLLSKMGSTDISTIGDGTVTGAISTLNANWSKIGTAAIEKLGGTVPVPNSKWTSVCIYYNLQPGTYLLIAQMSSRKSIQYARLCKGLDVNSILANTPYGSGTLFCILTLTEITTASLWVYQNAESPMNFNEGEASIISVRIK